MAGCDIKGQSKSLKGEPPNAVALQTQLGHCWPGWSQLAKSMDMCLIEVCLAATSPQRLFKPTTLESMLEQ